MVQRLTGDRALALLANTIATGGALIAILLIFGPISGAHLNPVVTLYMAEMKTQNRLTAAGYIAAQLVDGIVGAILANAT